MSKVTVQIVHDELGRIKSISRPSHGATATISCGAGESILVTEIEEEGIHDAINNRRVDTVRNVLT